MSVFPEVTNFSYPTKKDGSPVVVTITGAIERVKSDNPKLNYKSQDKDSGYYDVIPVVDENGNESKMKISTWKVYFGIKALKPEVGDTIEIIHVKNGEYKITKK